MQTETKTIIDDVLGLTTFAPNAHVNAVMSALVAGVVEETIPAKTLDTSTAQKVRRISSKAESGLEMFWAERIARSLNPASTMHTFPYRDNYIELIRRELELVKNTGLDISNNSSVLVIGSGPLPLSAYELYRQTGAKVEQVDVSTKAAMQGEAVSRALDMPTEYYVGSGETVALKRSYDLVLIAALAGDTLQMKQQIIDNILQYISDDGRIVVRTARGDRSLLYPVIEGDALMRVKLLGEYHPNDYIINSVLIYGK